MIHFSQHIKSFITKPLLLASATMAVCAPAMASDMKPGEGVKVTPIFSTVLEERFRGQIAIDGLEALGYDVQEPKETAYATMFLALSNGDADFTVHMWNKLHDTFYQRSGGDDTIMKVGVVMPGVLQGYQIDKKTADKYHITSLADLKDPKIAKLFDINGDGKADLTGCNPGWGCELVIDHEIKAYGLEKTVTQDRGSYFALMADTITRYKQGKPVLFYTWSPQWIGGVLKVGEDTTWLSVPYTDLPGGKNDVVTTFQGKNLGFAVDEVMAVVNKDFAKKNPAAVAFLSQFQITPKAESIENLQMRNGEKSLADIKRHARDWIKAHQQEYDSWLAAARKAAKE
ncbi:glycine betaine/L-proline ABC transporter substrate-binding protein ProX [Marinomonas sp. TI.3.20]|uniref:glycine betaine/L-proline ABC transporter substrate-binding protein ProX n=1 Tax=Marinomonas sp. TI.3.20 TaxID=3121296 RepID=UPI00311E0917